MADIILVKGMSPLSVRLNVELRTYFEACRALLDSRAQLTRAKDSPLAAEPDSASGCPSMLEKARINHLSAEKAYKHERHEFELELMGLQGSSHWGRIKEMLSEQCCLESPIENQLYISLIKRETQEPTLPLAVESLDYSFIELLKNSIDAKRKQYLGNVADTTMLEMDIAFILDGLNITVTISDNAGGFTDFYIKEFSENIQSKAYKYKTHFSEKRHYDEFSLGGAGRGMNILCNFIMDGEQLMKPGLSRKDYSDTEGFTAIHIDNNTNTRGAKITLHSPITPFTPFVLCREDSFSGISRENTPTSASPLGREASPSFFATPLQLAEPSLWKKKITKTTISPLMPTEPALSPSRSHGRAISLVVSSPWSRPIVDTEEDTCDLSCEELAGSAASI